MGTRTTTRWPSPCSAGTGGPRRSSWSPPPSGRATTSPWQRSARWPGRAWPSSPTGSTTSTSPASLPVARGELERSRALIARWTGRPVRFFAYPAGRFTPALVQLLRQVGYRGAVTEIPGFVTASSHPFTLERVRVDHDDTLASFAHKLDLPLP